MPLLPDELWVKILREWVGDAVDWSHFSQTCRHFYRTLPRPRPLQLVTREVRYPRVLFFEQICSPRSDTSEEYKAGTKKEELRLLCFNLDHDDDDGDAAAWEENEQSSPKPLIDILCREGAHFRIFTYCDGDKAYLEPFYYNSSFNCEKGAEGDRRVEGYGLVFHYEASSVKASYQSSYRPNLNCFWQIRQRMDSPSWMELRYGDESSSMIVDFDSFLKAFILINSPVWADCLLEDYDATSPFFLSRTPVWHEQWRQRLYGAVPCQPRPFVSHSYQTNIFAPNSWEDVDYVEDDIADFILTGRRTALVNFSMQLCDSHIVIRAPVQSFALRLPLLQKDLERFSSANPAAWLQYLFELRSRRWFVARKYWRLAADVQETRRNIAVETVVRDWPLLHPEYVYRVDNGDFLVELPSTDIAKDPETGENIQQQSLGEENQSKDTMWCAVLHG